MNCFIFRRQIGSASSIIPLIRKPLKNLHFVVLSAKLVVRALAQFQKICAWRLCLSCLCCKALRRASERVQVFNRAAFNDLDSVRRVPSVLTLFHHKKAPDALGCIPASHGLLTVRASAEEVLPCIWSWWRWRAWVVVRSVVVVAFPFVS